MLVKFIPEGELVKVICPEPLPSIMANILAAAGVCFADCDPFLSGLDAANSTSTAISENPRNVSITIPVSQGPLQPPISPPPNLAIFTAKFWSPGRQLKVGFLSGTDWQKSKVKQHAQTWTAYGNFSFTFVDSGDCDFLIDFNPRLGSWSYLGTDCGYYSSKKQASMNLGWIDQDRSEDQLSQVILHEFGHALGGKSTAGALFVLGVCCLYFGRPSKFRRSLGRIKHAFCCSE